MTVSRSSTCSVYNRWLEMQTSEVLETSEVLVKGDELGGGVD